MFGSIYIGLSGLDAYSQGLKAVSNNVSNLNTAGFKASDISFSDVYGAGSVGGLDYLRVFVEGLTHLVRDEFTEAIARMQAGMALNAENTPLNNDIRLLIVECEKLASGESGGGDAGGGSGDMSDLSATSIMLGQFSPGSTKH